MGVRIEKKHLDSIFKLIQTGNRGWYNTDCPYCGKKEHLGINFGGIGSFNCFKCGEKGTIFKLLKYIGRLDILGEIRTINIYDDLKPKILITHEEETINIDLKKKQKPLGFRRVQTHEYFKSRNISEDLFNIHEIGLSKLETKLKNYLVFLFTYKEECVGWIARSFLDAEQISKIENKTGRKYLRYINSPNVDFAKYLFGYNEITQETETVILVEGIFDKLRIDSNLELHKQNNIKCCACFGKKISKYQIFLLQQLNVKKIILLYDNDAVNESKQYSNELFKYFDVEVGYCKKKDPGDMDIDELAETFAELKSPLNFSLSIVSKKKLK